MIANFGKSFLGFKDVRISSYLFEKIKHVKLFFSKKKQERKEKRERKKEVKIKRNVQNE